MKQTLRFFILFVVLSAVSPLFAQQQTRTTSGPGIPGLQGYPATPPQARNGPGNPAPQNGNGTLGQIYNFTKCGLGFTQASQRLGQRFTPQGVLQPATFAISGIPACATIEQAYLWAEGSGDGSAQTATIVNPSSTSQNFPMALVGSGPDKCWGYSGSHTYRASVTPIINGNGNYTISGLMVSPPTSGNDMDGATLMIIYSDPSAAFRGTMVIHDGAVVINGGTTTQTLTGMSVCQNVTAANATAFCMVGDIQMTGQTCTMNGTNAPFAWNWWNYVQVNTALTLAQTTAAYTMTSGGDCFNLAVVGMYFRTTCTPCTSSSLTLTPSSTPATCSNCNGTASVSVSPAGSYTYSWAPSGGNAATATGLCPGTYTVTVSNACNTATVAVTVGNTGGGLTVNSAGQTNVNCYGNCTGSATATVTGGTGPYTYSWAPSGGNAPTATGLCAGTYTINVTDANGCTGNRTFTITQPPQLTNTFTQTSVLCNGGNTGSASVTASGGTPGYTFSWSPAVTNTTSGSTNTATGLSAGTYVCTITDLNGCTSTRTITITQPPALANTFTQVNVLCNGGNTGSASVTASGGTPAYTFSWSPAVVNTTSGSTNTATGLGAGTYVCTITDLNGCTSTRTVTITQPPALTNTFTQVNLLCNGANNGSATVTASGGTPGYTFSWSPAVANTTSGSSNTATGLGAGTYVCTITDLNGCTSTRTVTITQPAALTNTFTQTSVLCNGGNTGTASVTASGGTPGYTFSWSPAVTNTTSGNTNSATGLAAGTYVCTITDLNGCISTRTITINQPPALALTTSSTSTTCGNNNGSVTVSSTGGTGVVNFLWTPGNYTTATVSNLAAGSYVVTATDANGCTATATVTVNNSSAIASTQTSVNVLCNGNTTGSATINVTGNNGTVTYVWSPNVSTTNSASNLAAGTYVVTATDATGCVTSQTIIITQPTALTNTFTQSNVLCNGGNTGSATVTAAGGTPGYTFSWSPAVTNTTSGNTNSATGLAAGTYVCTITDLNGCISTRTITITQPPALALTTSSTSTTCGNNNGSVTVSSTGGTGVVNFLWTPGNYTTATVSNLAAGSYVVTATDANGCSATATVTVNSSSAIASTQTSVNVLCNGNTTGSATINVTGNNGPVTYVWAPNVSTTNSASNLAAGTYVVTATDATGCPTSQTIVITQPTALTNTFTQSNVLCNGGNTGSATVTAAGGTPGYTFVWSPAVTNTTSGSSNTATGLGAGTYVCTITDLNGCISTQTITITQPTAISLSVNTVPSTCGNPNGSITATASGGTGTLNYLWTPGNYTTATVNNLSAGPYTVVVTDANNCTATAIGTINNLGSPSINVTAFTNVSCFNGSDGTALSLASGGTGPLSCLWSNGDSTWAISNLPAGSYVVTVTDANNCTDTASVTISQPVQLTSVHTATSVSCFGGSNATATVTGSGGTGAYTFSWNPAVTNSSSGNSNTATALAAGSYVCTITDANNCTATETVIITQPTALASQLAATDATCNAGCNGTLSATISGGTPGYTYNWSSGCTTANCSNICAGTYTLTATDSLGCTITDSITVNEPPAMSVQMQSTPAYCNQANGYVNAIGSGGTGNLSYVWNPGNLAQQSSNVIPPGTYSVTVTDQNNCWIIDSITVSNIPGVAVAGNPSTSVSCYNGTDGAASVTATGGTAPYTYSWVPNVSSTSAASSLAAGSYVVLVVDSAGCSATTTVTVTQPIQLTATAGASPAAVCAGQSVTLTATPAGGTPGYTANWQPIGVNNLQTTYVPFSSGTFTVTVTDLNGCTTTATTSVVVNPQPTPQFSGTPTQGCAPLCVNFTDLTGAGTWTWNWDFGDGNTGTGSGTPTNCYTLPGSYDVQLTVTDPATGCTGTITQTNFVTVFANPVAAFGSSPTNATMVNPTIFFTDSSSGAVAWNWSFGDLLNSSSTVQNPSFAYPSAGCYEVTLTVTSADGCTDIATDSVCIDLEATLFVPNAFTPNGDGDNEVFLPLGIGLDPAQYQLWIYDRWGNMIFFTDNPQTGWDGRANNGAEIAQQDVYVWKLKCADVTGRKHNLLGTVTLIK
ncbi:MAG: PKD domain-containing protein [Bacteroidia bacterium]|jgi:gliding motility-associated-like protein|nr:PKD domain-containing protein [Bacteroidia bacterium]